MYSSYWKPNDGRESTILTDHEALHRDEATHRSIQSDETQLRPLDLETIMSGKAALKFWYLHRPKTMEYVHKNATKIQSVGRAFAVRRLKKQYGAEYVAELARRDAAEKEKQRLEEMDEEERAIAEREMAEYEARVEETRRLRREKEEKERQEEEERQRLLAIERKRIEDEEAAVAAAALAASIAAKEERLRVEAERRRIQEEEEEKLRLQHEAEEAERLRIEQEEEAERLRIEEEEEAERLRLEKEEEERQAAILAQEEEERRITQMRLEAEKREEDERLAAEAAIASAQAIARQQEEERERERRAQREEKYEQSLSRDVPVFVQHHGPGRVINYDKENECYNVQLEEAMGGKKLVVGWNDLDLDEERILSPRRLVDTPFGVCHVVGLDPHVGVYAVEMEELNPDGMPNRAYVQIRDVKVHVPPMEEDEVIVENKAMPIPDEIKLVSAYIVDSRVVNRTGKKFIQYKLKIKTSNYGTVYCWKRYSTFRSLCDRLVRETGVKRRDIPELPKKMIVGNYSAKAIGERADKLNQFLAAAVAAEHLQWGIRVDDDISVYKRRVKSRSAPNSTPRSAPRSTPRSMPWSTPGSRRR